MGECWGSGTATFLILGDVCTRACRFCDVKHGKPGELDWDEPERVAQAVSAMNSAVEPFFVFQQKALYIWFCLLPLV